jgi:hypothetical protein
MLDTFYNNISRDVCEYFIRKLFSTASVCACVWVMMDDENHMFDLMEVVASCITYWAVHLNMKEARAQSI